MQRTRANTENTVQTEKYLFLWPLAEKYFECATALLKVKGLVPQFGRLINAGLHCLRVVLKDPTISSMVELKTRKRICQILLAHTTEYAEAEDMLNKALIITKQMNLIHEQFALNGLLAHVFKETSPNAAKRLLQRCSQDAEQYAAVASPADAAIAYKWVYEYYLASQCFQGDAFIAKNIGSYASKHNHKEMYLLGLLLAHEDIPETIRPRNWQLTVLVKLARTLYSLGIGDVATSRDRLRSLHIELEQDELNWPSADVAFHVQDDAYLITHWVSLNQLYIIVYLVSGLCYLGDTNSGRAERFFCEGLRLLETYAFDDSDARHLYFSKLWSDKTRHTFYAYLTCAYLNRSNIASAEQYATKLDSSPFSNVIRAMLCHRRGQTDSALAMYKNIMMQQNIGEEIFVLAVMNVINILRDTVEANRFLEAIEKICTSQHNTQYATWWAILKAVRNPDKTAQTNELLYASGSASAHANTQMQYVTLLPLCARLKDTQQIEKMALNSYLMAKKSKDIVWTFLTGSVLENVYHSTQDQERISQQHRQNEIHHRQLQKFLRTTT
ncbi:cohesin loading factor Ssl3 [Schizosaccharomyces japonicus yFS275]|uniref:Cohesin loading factor Ssl3 n=1 Tax=Schizosaccharomyces japonicus (strain yFS275 / FY16936) TaxID=402676 RepID=B6JWA8_SCHJY|nr:cohesin loading factor Ssl3 [Schizosaccharomyces japonicus yFS275]EEB05659.1 cohesin loading factor Ssl3 [Schizosaccharomyces japonicus yFS275]